MGLAEGVVLVVVVGAENEVLSFWAVENEIEVVCRFGASNSGVAAEAKLLLRLLLVVTIAIAKQTCWGSYKTNLDNGRCATPGKRRRDTRGR